MTNRLIAVPAGFELTQGNGEASQDLQQWMEDATDLINNSLPLSGTGSPEGVQAASVRRLYIDNAAPLGEGIYFKQTGDGVTGWVKRS